ncbi:MAG: DNA translocase FtsK [Elusimicrobiaceae bacterium]|nr:DNA translocase FtsK [Elusimicrobiaceae bacterium]
MARRNASPFDLFYAGRKKHAGKSARGVAFYAKKKQSAKAGRRKTKTPAWLPAVGWIFTVSLTLWLIWIQWVGGSSGALGRILADGLFKTFGHASYLFPLLMLYGLATIFFERTEKAFGALTLATGITFVLVSSSAELALLKLIFTGSLISGGVTGEMTAALLDGILGKAGAGIIGMGIFVAGVHILFGIPWKKTISAMLKWVREDYAAWTAGRTALARRIEAARGDLPVPAEECAARNCDITDCEVSGEPARPAREKLTAPIKIMRGGNSGSPPAKPRPAAVKKTAEKAEEEAPLPLERPPFDPKTYEPPSLDLLNEPPANRLIGPSDDEIAHAKQQLEETLASFEIKATVTGALAGPVITRYELKPEKGVKVSSIVSLENDIALAMKAKGIRIEAPIPGKDAIGLELPNEKPVMVYLREILEDPALAGSRNKLAVAVGRHADGAPATANLEKMPHLLVAGATNSGKSICLQTFILSLVYRARPDEVKFLMIDPKRLELTFYEGIPHLYDPKTPAEQATVITDSKEAVASLKALVKVMETRYKILEAAKVRNMESYNKWAEKNGEPHMFFIVVIIDELADLMLQTKAAVEDSIQRLAQMARAVGIHLVLCTQRPSVNVITGVIKANLPSRIALQVTSRTDSRVILDSQGAENLLGKGDMLYLAIDAQKPSRMQGAYVSEEEIRAVADHLRKQGRPDYPVQLRSEKADEEAFGPGMGISVEDFKAALNLILQRRRISQDLLKAHFGSSARATNILSVLEIQGFISKPEGSNRWDIQFDKIEQQAASFELTVNSPVSAGNGE